ncbi:Uncharacterized protein GBIM_08184 [Gryllus bimaculatus]|nr:Uncharacterized protein GBIM_08184 [Gryllus bimaculatus]
MSDIFPLLSLDEVRFIVTDCAGTTDFEVLEVHESSVSSVNGGFMSDYWRMKIRVRLEDGTEKSYKFFAKTVPRNAGEHRQFVLEVQCYVKEVGFYRKILPLLLKHLEKLDSARDTRDGRWAPRCFFTRDDIVVMEDLSEFGFESISSRELLDWNKCAAVLKKMAIFHAASIIFEEKEQMLTGKKCSIGDLHPQFFAPVLDKSMPDDENKGWFKAGVRASVALVPYLPKYKHNRNLQQMIQEKMPGAFESIAKYRTSDKFRNVVCHGDLWSSNILFCQNKDTNPETVYFVDYQNILYVPPAMDILIFINTTNSKSFRERYHQEIVNVYYETFSSELLNHGLSPDDILSLEELHNSLKYFGPPARVIAALYYQLIVMDSETKKALFSSPDYYSVFFLIDRSSDVRKCFEEDEIYRNRLEEALNELIENDILN